MEEGLRSLVRSLRAFIGFWFAFLCATLCNTLIPIDTLRETFPLSHVITDAMVELRLKFLEVALKDGKLNIIYAAWTLLISASTNFIGYFKEIFVIVTLFHFTPLLQGVEIYLTTPRWFRKLMSWLGVARMRSATAGEYVDMDDSADDDASEPPELEDCSQLFAGDNDGYGTDLPDEGEIRSTTKNYHSHGAPNALDSNVTGRSLDAAGLHAYSLSNAPKPAVPLPDPRGLGDPTPLSPGRRAKDGRDWYVYDPVFGVIPQETRDLWQAQESGSLQRREAASEAQAAQKQKRQVPPVRYSQKGHGES